MRYPRLARNARFLICLVSQWAGTCRPPNSGHVSKSELSCRESAARFSLVPLRNNPEPSFARVAEVQGDSYGLSRAGINSLISPLPLTREARSPAPPLQRSSNRKEGILILVVPQSQLIKATRAVPAVQIDRRTKRTKTPKHHTASATAYLRFRDVYAGVEPGFDRVPERAAHREALNHNRWRRWKIIGRATTGEHSKCHHDDHGGYGNRRLPRENSVDTALHDTPVCALTRASPIESTVCLSIH